MKTKAMLCERCIKNEGEVKASARLVQPGGVFLCDRHRDEYHRQDKEFSGFIEVKRRLYDWHKISISPSDYRAMVAQTHGSDALRIKISEIKSTKHRIEIDPSLTVFIVELFGRYFAVLGGKSRHHRYITTVLPDSAVCGLSSRIHYDIDSGPSMGSRMPLCIREKLFGGEECQKPQPAQQINEVMK